MDQVSINPSLSKKSPLFSIKGENRIMLKERRRGEYTRSKMEKLLKAKNPIRCKLLNALSVMYCKII